jgi:hypothetical protein
VVLCHAWALWSMDERFDPFYLKLAGPPRTALILGTSRASQGIDPAVLDSTVAGGYQGPFHNFAFTTMHSPFGPAYLHAIRRKLDPNTTRGLFVVTVDPWSLSLPADHPPAPVHEFPEDDSFLNTLTRINGDLRLEYFIRSYNYGWGSLLAGPLHRTDLSEVRENGLLIVTAPLDSAIMAKRTRQKTEEYRVFAEGGKRHSPEREAYLLETCTTLMGHGRVALVRMPIHPAIRELEDRFRPDFSRDMQELASKLGIPWLDHSSAGDSLAFTDGNHLTYGSAQSYSRQLGTELQFAFQPDRVP